MSSAVLAGNMGTFELAMIGVIIAFIPLIVSTALATGVYQAVRLTSVMLVGCRRQPVAGSDLRLRCRIC
ncbi:MAG: YhfT family protein [Holdemania massiliensis]